jgi:glycosyltransferase involved in cell wall biosynthesis
VKSTSENPIPPRIAFCTDTFDEANGVATLSRAFAAYARKHQLPFLVVRPAPHGGESRTYKDGSVTFVELGKSRLCLPLDMGLRFDLLVWRQADWLRQQLNAFHPDIVHITGPGDIGMVSARLAHTLRVPKPPLVAAWHTNAHQYARMRAMPLLKMLPARFREAVGSKIESISFQLTARFYRAGRLLLAPNQEILDQLMRQTGKPGKLMSHGVDSDLFAPPPGGPKRLDGGIVTLGYAGRLTAEKNVRFLVELAEGLESDVRARVRFLIAGDGAQRAWLESHLPKSTTFTGVLRGEDLARAYREMDVFLFPSFSDTFGLVVLEAMSTGVPVVSFKTCGPNSVVEDGLNGFAASTSRDFIDSVTRLALDSDLRERMGLAARKTAVRQSWESVFSGLFESYDELISTVDRQRTLVPTS